VDVFVFADVFEDFWPNGSGDFAEIEIHRLFDLTNAGVGTNLVRQMVLDQVISQLL